MGGLRKILDLKVNVLALVAFVLSLCTAGYQLYGFLKGPDIQSHPPYQITIHRQHIGDAETGFDLVQFIVPLTYVNKGQEGYNGLVTEDRIEFEIAGKKYVHHWYEFVTCSIKKNKLDQALQGDAQPVLVAANNVVGHTTAFYARMIDTADKSSKWGNFLRWEDFCSTLKNEKALVLKIVSTIEGRKKPVECTHTLRVPVDADLQHNLETRGWAAAACWKVKP
jgi:hypothetical protein